MPIVDPWVSLLRQEEKVLCIGGVVAMTTTDYPKKLAAVVFVRGCPWRCGHCHNPHLQSRRPAKLDVDWDDFLSFLSRRVGLLDAVVFSGGEPTVDTDLPVAIETVRSMGFSVGLHTAGCYPDRLQKVSGMVDWIGLDIKTIEEDYAELTKAPGSGKAAFESLDRILASDVDFECRTTISPDWLPENKLRALAHQLREKGVKQFALQRFRAFTPKGPVLGSTLPPDYPSKALLAECQNLFNEFSIR